MNNDKMDALFSGLLGGSQPDSQEEHREEIKGKEETSPEPKRRRGRPSTAHLPKTDTRFCTIVDLAILEKIRAIAKIEGLDIKEVVNAAFEKAINTYESRHGKIKVSQDKPRQLF